MRASHQVVRCDLRGVVPAALQKVHGLAVADGARCALLIRPQALPKQPVGLLQITYSSAISRANAVQALVVACHMRRTSPCNMVSLA